MGLPAQSRVRMRYFRRLKRFGFSGGRVTPRRDVPGGQQPLNRCTHPDGNEHTALEALGSSATVSGTRRHLRSLGSLEGWPKHHRHLIAVPGPPHDSCMNHVAQEVHTRVLGFRRGEPGKLASVESVPANSEVLG